MSKLKVVSSKNSSRGLRLSHMCDGDLFRFVDKIHQDNGIDDVFIKVHNSYKDINEQWKKLTVINLTRYRVSMVSEERRVFPIKGILSVED